MYIGSDQMRWWSSYEAVIPSISKDIIFTMSVSFLIQKVSLSKQASRSGENKFLLQSAILWG